MSEKTCPNCGNPAAELLRLDGNLKGRLQSDLGMAVPPESVCPNCYNALSTKLSKETQKKNRRAAKEQHRLNLWRSRVHLIRDARERVNNKDFAGAIVAYEKYLRVLEIIYEVKPNCITAVHFNNSARSKELTVIASAYWDLVRIYDQSPRFVKRLEQCAEKLAEFLPLTPIYPEINKKIQDYARQAKHQEIFQKKLRISRFGSRRCFIATAAFQDPQAPTVEILATYRDQVLEQNPLGKLFTRAYYQVSPPVAGILDQSAFLRSCTRHALTRLATRLDKKYNLKSKQP